MTDVERIRLPEQLSEPISHYTDGARGGNMLFVSGMLPTDASGALVGAGDGVAQADQVLANIKAVLDAAGATFADVLKVTVYLRNVDDRPRVNTVRQKYFGQSRPASTLVEISRLAIEGALVEVDAVAYVAR